MDKLSEFIKVFELPPAMVPYLNLIVTEQEMDLVIGLSEHAMTIQEVAEMMQMTAEETAVIVENAVHRDIVKREKKEEKAIYLPSVFYAHLDFITAFETGTWMRIPHWTREAVVKWQEQAFINLWLPAIERIVEDPDAWVKIKNRDILLLEESIELIEAADDICLLPCTCQTVLYPDRPIVEGSIRLGGRVPPTLDKGQGRRLTKAEAKAHLIMLDRWGLVHTGLRDWRRHDPNLDWMSHGNCHPAYSVPFRAGMYLGLTKIYPKVHHVARVDWGKCNRCGICIGRCPFHAFYHDGTEIVLHGQRMRHIVLDLESCWGCGLCATTCPENAIEMSAL